MIMVLCRRPIYDASLPTDPNQACVDDPGYNWVYSGNTSCAPAPSTPSEGDDFLLPTAPAVPTSLALLDDCYERDFGIGLVRRREYELLDQYGQPFMGLAITHETVVASNPISANASWVTAPGSPPTFYDFYSNGSNVSSTLGLQIYSSIYFAMLGVSVSPLLMALEPQSYDTTIAYMIQGIYYSSSYVNIDYFREIHLSPGNKDALPDRTFLMPVRLRYNGQSDVGP